MPKVVMKKYAIRLVDPKEYQLNIDKDPSKNRFKVREFALEVEEGSILIWHPHGTAATVSFDRIGGQQVVDPEKVDILDEGEGTLQVLPDVIERIGKNATNYGDGKKIYVPYKVYCDTSNSYAEGGSDPKIIVKP
jgi:hypothetical protein